MEYGMLFTFLIIAIIFTAAGLIVNFLLMPYKPNKEKNSTYECGVEPIGDARIRYNIRFYVFALMYVVFAVEAVFLIPWAIIYKSFSGFLPLIEGLIFILILLLGLFYAWKKGDLKWV